MPDFFNLLEKIRHFLNNEFKLYILLLRFKKTHTLSLTKQKDEKSSNVCSYPCRYCIRILW